MTFSTAIQKAYSRRTAFVRISARVGLRYTAIETSPTTWEFQLPSKPTSVTYETGSSLTEDDTLSSLGTWSYNQATKTLTIKRAAYTGDEETVAQFNFYLTDGQDVALPSDPSLTSGDLVMWEDRIKQSPTITQSIENMSEGVMSVSASTLTLENSDHYFNKFFTNQTSLHGEEIKVWFDVEGNKQLQMTGEVRTIDPTSTTISIGIVDKFTSLSNPTYMGSTVSEATYPSDSTSHIDDRGKPIPMLIGNIKFNGFEGPLKFVNGASSAVMEYLPQLPELEDRFRAVAFPYDGVINSTHTNNRVWSICRTLSTPVDTITTGTVTDVVWKEGASNKLEYNGAGVDYYFIESTGYSVEPGDSIVLQSGGGSKIYCVTFNVKSNGTGYYVFAPGSYGANPSDSSVAYTVHAGTPAVSLYVRRKSDGRIVVPTQSGISTSNYTVSTTALSNGTSQVKVQFTNGWGASRNLQEFLDPNLVEVFYRVRMRQLTADKRYTGQLMQQALNYIGFSVDATSASAVDAEVNSECSMFIPEQGITGTHPTAADIASQLAQSAGGYIRTDQDGTVYFNKFETPTPVNNIRTDDDVLSSSLVPRVSYYDMYKTVTIESVYGAKSTAFPTDLEDATANYLYSTSRVKKITSVTRFAPATLQTRLKQLMLKPRITYTYKTATLDLDTNIGDAITLQTSNLLGDVGEVTILVTKIIKSTTEVSVTGIHL